MEKISIINGIVAPLDRSNVDTDAIIPKQFLKSIARTGFGENCFDEWRYLDHGEPGQDNSSRPINPDFVFNQVPYQHAPILLTRHNFGCGSSREHAPWALQQYGIRVIIAPSFADIFYNNCFKNGLLPIVLPESSVEQLFQWCAQTKGYTLSVDLSEQKIEGDHFLSSFDVDAFRKHCLLNGLDDIGLTLQHQEKIKQFEAQHLARFPWLSQSFN